MHSKEIDVETIIAALGDLEAGELLQLEERTYTRKDGSEARRGPYWYFHYREGGKQKTLYIGKTAEPEAGVDRKL